jgi:hexokinase
MYMAVDLGGTNFRVCSIQLHGDSTFGLQQSKVKIPASLMKPPTTSKQLFRFLALQIELFLKEHHCEQYASHVQAVKAGEAPTIKVYDMGFTFSFPVSQVAINSGHLIRWTKGFDIPDAVGQDICLLLQTEIDALMLPVRVAALVNDTVGTLMARSYTSPGQGTGTLLGAIFGTGTNGAYVEKLERVTKLKDTTGINTSTGLMIINTEWGSFDNVMKSLPNTKYDRDLDATTPNPGIQMFEKRISGMYLGEILRRAIVHLVDTDDVPLLKAKTSATNELLHTTPNLNRRGSEPAALFKQWGVDSSFLSVAVADVSEHQVGTRQAIERDFGVDAAGVEDAKAVRRVAGAVGRRAARLSAVAIGAIVVNSGRLDTDEVVDVGVDGSLVEFYPDFEKHIREA